MSVRCLERVLRTAATRKAATNVSVLKALCLSVSGMGLNVLQKVTLSKIQI